MRKRKNQKGKKYTKAQIEEMRLLKSLRFTTGSKSSFWSPGSVAGGDYVPPVPDGELVRSKQG